MSNNQTSKKGYMYLKIMDQILNDINTGVYNIGDMLPTQEEFAQLYGVSRVTVREAIKELIRRDILTSTRGRGTIVNSIPEKSELSSSGKVSSFTFVQRDEKKFMPSKLRCLEKILPPKHIAIKLGISTEDPVIKIERLRFSGNVPLMLSTAYLPYKYVNNVDFLNADLETSSLYDLLYKEAGISFTRANEYMRALMCPEDIAPLLGLFSGEPLIHISRSTMFNTPDGEEAVGEYSEHYVRTDIGPVIIHNSNAR